MTPPSRVLQYLEEHGPTSIEDLPYNPHGESLIANGIWKFNIGPKAASRASEGSLNEKKTIYYLPDHDEKDVVRMWMDCNAKQVENLTERGLKQRLGKNGPQWKQPIREVMRERGLDGTMSQNTGGQNKNTNTGGQNAPQKLIEELGLASGSTE
jgi:hypothetical protein